MKHIYIIYQWAMPRCRAHSVDDSHISCNVSLAHIAAMICTRIAYERMPEPESNRIKQRAIATRMKRNEMQVRSEHGE